MDYKVLYRKYRPTNFNELYDQENIKNILLESIINNKISHSYLFFGPRGTGKTSTAKLFAKTINCENSTNGIPCNECNSCKNYEQSPDIIEIDAASNNGVDEIRELRENAKVLPSMSRYKVYIIDEVHMLSQSAWNAFLKILEEPPKHVIFILATTEIQKIPITILSRCQRFNFQRISNKNIVDNIIRISKLENIDITPEGAEYIASLSDGGMRDALSILDQLSKNNKTINKELIINNFGFLSNDEVNQLFINLNSLNLNKFENDFQLYINRGLDISLLINNILNYLYLQIINKENNIFVNETEIKVLAEEISTCLGKSNSIVLLKIILISHFVNRNSVKTISSHTPEIISREIISEGKKEEKKLTEKNDLELQDFSRSSIITDEKKQIRINNSFCNASKVLKSEFKNNWETFIKSKFIKNNIEINPIVEELSIQVVSPTNVIFSSLSQSISIIFNEKINILEEEYNKFTKDSKKFICISNEEWNEEKNNFIKNKNKKYNYIDEENQNNLINTYNTACSIFDKNLIEVE